MKRIRMVRCALLSALACALASAASAAPLRLVGAVPTPNSHVEWPKQVHLNFNAKVDPAKATITMIKPDGSTIPLEAPMAADGDKGLMAEVKQPMLAGPYMVQWQVQAAGGAAAKGDYTFFVN